MASFVTVVAASLLAIGALSGGAEAAPPSHSAVNRNLVEVQWPGPGGPGGPGYGQDWQGRAEHCGRMRERLQQIRYRMQYAPPWERDRLGTRLYEIRERLRHACWGHWREEYTRRSA